MAAGIPASVPEQHDQHDDKGDRTNGGADGDSRRRVGIAPSLQVIPYLSDADKNENERPVGPENRHGIETRMPIAEEKKRDRKSTRLNSSHLVISYAVFCLKKKN